MRRSIYNLFIRPKKPSKDWQDKEVILNALLFGTLVLLAVAVIVSTLSYIQSGSAAVAGRVILMTAFWIVTAVLYISARKGYSRAVANLLVVLYIIIVCIIMFWLGVYNPAGILLAGFLIPLSGMLLGHRYALGMIAFVITLMVVVTIYERPPMEVELIVLRGVVLAVMLGMIGLISWLFIRQVQQSQARAMRYQAKLIDERDNLEERVKERTQELQTAQQDKMQQMHRFAELGYISTATLHDLANHLTSISLDVESLQKTNQSDAMGRIEQNVAYIEDAISRARQHIRGKKIVTTFNLHDEITQLVRALQHNNEINKVLINYIPPASRKRLTITGNVVGMRQIISGLIVNAIESYPGKSAGSTDKPQVVVGVHAGNKAISITVSDKGKGMPAKMLAQVFEPFYSTKKSNMGMGLFICKQLVEQDFKGSLKVVSNENDGTVFTVIFPTK